MKKLETIIKIAILSEVVEADFDLEAAAKRLGMGRATIYRWFKVWKLATPVGGNPGSIKLSEYKLRCSSIELELGNLREVTKA